jgi:hypothetical protein
MKVSTHTAAQSVCLVTLAVLTLHANKALLKRGVPVGSESLRDAYKKRKEVAYRLIAYAILFSVPDIF